MAHSSSTAGVTQLNPDIASEFVRIARNTSFLGKPLWDAGTYTATASLLTASNPALRYHFIENCARPSCVRHGPMLVQSCCCSG